MKKISIFIIVFLTLHSCTNNNSEILPCNLEVQNNITYNNGKKYSGTCNIFYNDSILWKTRTYKRGRETKEVSYYIVGGNIEYIGNKKNGKIHGDFVSYYTNGEISIQGKLKMGKYIGEWNYYDDDGSLNKILNYSSEGDLIDSLNYK